MRSKSWYWTVKIYQRTALSPKARRTATRAGEAATVALCFWRSAWMDGKEAEAINISTASMEKRAGLLLKAVNARVSNLVLQSPLMDVWRPGLLCFRLRNPTTITKWELWNRSSTASQRSSTIHCHMQCQPTTTGYTIRTSHNRRAASVSQSADIPKATTSLTWMASTLLLLPYLRHVLWNT